MPITNYNSVPHYVDEGANVHIKKPTQPGAGTQPVTTPAAPQSATGYGYGQSKAAVPDAGSNVDTLRAAYEASKTQAAASPVTSPAAAAPAATVPAAETLEAVPAAAEGLSPYEARELASYRAQEDAVNRLYEARQRAKIQALRDAYDQNMLNYQAAREDIAPVFEAQRNATAAESERQRAAFNEYAAARGLNSGAGGQAELARGNVLAGNLNALNTEQARQETEIDRSIAALKAQYKNAIAQAKADNDYQRLADLLAEYRTQEQSIVNTSANQADEDYKAWAAQYNAYRDSVGDKQYAEQFNYQKERDAVSDNQWERQFALSKARSSGSSGGGYSSKSSKTTEDTAPISEAQKWSGLESYLAAGGSASTYLNVYYKELGYKDAEQAYDAYQLFKFGEDQAQQGSSQEGAGGYEPPYPITTFSDIVKNAQYNPAAAIPTNYAGAVNYLRTNGKAEAASGLISEEAFEIAKQRWPGNSRQAEAMRYDTYEDYLRNYLEYAMS